MVRSLVINFLIVPVAAFILIRVLALPKATAVTLILASAAPGAPFAPKLAVLADADIACAIGLTFVLSLLAVLITPLMVHWADLGREDTLINVLPIVSNLLLFQLLPLLTGLVIQHRRVLLAKRLLPLVKILSDVTFAALLVVILSNNFDVLFGVGWSSFTAMVIFTAATLVSAWQLGVPETRIRKALTLTTGSRNLALVLLIAVNSFHTPGLEAAIIAFGLVELGLTSLLAIYFRSLCSVN